MFYLGLKVTNRTFDGPHNQVLILDINNYTVYPTNFPSLRPKINQSNRMLDAILNKVAQMFIFVDYLSAFILGIIEGITEFLPVSSTGHLILASSLLGISEEFVKSFEIAIQGGAIFSVVVLFWRSFINIEILKRIGIAFVPTAIVGIVFYKLFKELLGNESIVVWALLFGGAAIIGFEVLYSKNKKKSMAAEDIQLIPYKRCVAIGLCQSVSIIPGVSRSAATIVGGLAMGMNRETIVKFSFLLAVPTLLAATGYDAYESHLGFSSDQLGILVAGAITSFLVALVAIKFFLNFVRKYNLMPFGAYRIILAILFLILVL